jgi:hypothetical protein
MKKSGMNTLLDSLGLNPLGATVCALLFIVGTGMLTCLLLSLRPRRVKPAPEPAPDHDRLLRPWEGEV